MIEPKTSLGWTVRIDRPFFADRVDFYLVRYLPGWVEIMGQNGLIQRLPEGSSSEKVKPTFVLYGMESRAMLIALAEALETEGVKTPNDHKIQGLLDATRYHLEDLRKMLKLPEK